MKRDKRMTDPRQASQGGFTLIELMIVIAVMAILVTPLLYFEVFAHEKIYTCIFRQELTETGALALDLMAKDFRASRATRENFRDDKLAPDCLILDGQNGEVIVYKLDQKLARLTRSEFPTAAPDAVPSRIILGDNFSGFAIAPVAHEAGLISISLKFSRPMINSDINLDLAGVAARRMP